MKKNLILWLGTIIVTFLTGYLYNVTHEYYPVTGTIGIEGEKVSFKFDKVFRENSDYKILIRTEKEDINGMLFWKKKNDENWNSEHLKNEGTNLYSFIPDQKALTEILYKAELNYNNQKYELPGPVKILFLGEIHPIISFLFYFTLYGGLLLSTRTGFEFFNDTPKIGVYTIFTLIFFFLFTLAVNPLKIAYELGAINHRILPIAEMFTIRSLSFLVAWITGMVVIFNTKKSKTAAFLFSILTILIFLLVR